MEKLLQELDQCGWLRIIFYVDLKDRVYRIADSIG